MVTTIKLRRWQLAGVVVVGGGGRIVRFARASELQGKAAREIWDLRGSQRRGVATAATEGSVDCSVAIGLMLH
jgi:hypothetical protein